MKLLGISGTIAGSKTKIAVAEVLAKVKELRPDIECELLDLKQYDMQFCDGRPLQGYNEDTRKAVEKVASADFYVIGTPVFQCSLTGALKNLFDLLSPNAFRRKVVGFVATGGTYQHYLVIDNQLKPIVGYFRAFVAPGSVYLHNDHFDAAGTIRDPDALNRIRQLAEELVLMQSAWKADSEAVVR